VAMGERKELSAKFVALQAILPTRLNENAPIAASATGALETLATKTQTARRRAKAASVARLTSIAVEGSGTVSVAVTEAPGKTLVM